MEKCTFMQVGLSRFRKRHKNIIKVYMNFLNQYDYCVTNKLKFVTNNK